ncbi:extracellular catalytic domain type 1 short-chain-length polyhydroxyalkanoate depolymerase [Archangium lansingense]|uniref:PHB depolymerase family esterase n=1 Tax=Archangium lansingense TaxID=2995310 RepID=A0ABT4AJB8_9BACT|nr:PHB depolymerase family esterase [Archangium lansinium]MCY1081758.1 PHB depolymerase family esterase [Archangium lansinium]
MMKRRFGGAVGALLTLAVLGCEGMPQEAAPPLEALGVAESPFTQVTSFGTNPGNLKMWKYVPANMPANAPLVVALHGCTQQASAYPNTGWSALADQLKFYVLYPEQLKENNTNICFNWFEPGDIARDQGEALSIKQMVDKMKADHSIDGRRVFVTGLSAGAAMTLVMAAAYPDVFAGAAPMAGVPYKCATSMNDAFTCMSPGVDKTATAWRDLVRNAYPSYTGPYPKISLWHGTSDYVVKNTNQTEALEQWTAVHGIDLTADVNDTVAGYPHKGYKDAAGNVLVETYAITSMGHGTPIDPATKFPGGTVACGTAGAFILDTDICSTWYVAKFFGLDNSDAVPPTVSLSAPANGATLSGTVLVTASATDNVGIAKVEFSIDNTLVGTDTASPFEYSWNTAAATNGAHTLVARAYDTAGNTSTSSTLSVTVTGGISDTTAPTVAITFPTAGSTVAGAIDIAATASDDTGVTKVEFLIDGAVVGQGVASLQAGPYTYNWNTTSYSTGVHNLQARAYDAAGNTAASATVAVTVDQNSVRFTERFSNAGPDNADWSITEWALDASDQTGVTGSQSILGSATPSFNTVTRTASVSVTLTSNPRLTYWRKLDLSGANTSASASFRVVVNNGTDNVVDSVTKSGVGTITEANWTQRADIDLSAYANRTVILKFIVTATDTGSTLTRAKAWVDSISVGPPSASADTTPPTVNVTAPANAATVSGTVDVTASASDTVGVNKVEFYIDGSLADTDTVAPYVFTWNTAGVANGSHSLMAKAYDAANNVSTDNDTSVTVSNTSGGTTTVTFSSIAADDGYVKANADGTSPAVGTITTPAVGKGTDGKLNRSIFSFDTSSLPDTATIMRASLKVTLSSSSGDPWADPAAGNTLTIDLKNGTFGAATMETTDYAAAATAAGVAELIKFTTGAQSSADFNASGLAAINKTGKTQARLQFKQNPSGTAYVFLTEGTGAVLTVEYK